MTQHRDDCDCRDCYDHYGDPEREDAWDGALILIGIFALLVIIAVITWRVLQ